MLFNEDEMTELCGEMGIELVENTPDNQKKLKDGICDMFASKTETITLQNYTFGIINAVPDGYMIWNIGDIMPDGYIPLCRLKMIQPFDGAREIETDALKAIPCHDSRRILKAAACGLNTISKMRHYIRTHEKDKHPSEYIKSRIEICRIAAAALEKIENAENMQS